MRVQEKLKNIEDFNKAIYDYVDEDNIPSFLCINDKIRSVGKKLYWGIPLSKKFKIELNNLVTLIY